MNRNSHGDRRSINSTVPILAETRTQTVLLKGHAKTVCRYFASVALLGGVFATAPTVLSRDDAKAACVAVVNDVTCSGVETTPQIIEIDDAVVTTLPGFSVDTTGNAALNIRGDGALQYIDGNASPLTGEYAGLMVWSEGDSGVAPGSVTIDTVGTITGGDYGIRTDNFGSGATSIDATGTVTGLVAAGISADNRGTSLTVNAGSVSGGWYGITAVNSGTGATNVTASGSVTGTDIEGIHAVNGLTATDLTINAADVTGDSRGILAVNAGIGATSITASGAVRATGAVGSNGYDVRNRTTASDLEINAAAASGSYNGIYAENQGTGLASVTATDDVVGTQNYGILAVIGEVTLNPDGTVSSVGHTAGSDLTVDAVNVSGGADGIFAYNEGTEGSLAVTATGLVEGESGDGLVAFVRGGNSAAPTATTLTVNAATVNGGANGVDASNHGYGSTSITTTGDVVGTAGDGIQAYNANTALTVNAAAATGGVNGINARNDGSGATEVTATGTVTGGSGAGIFALGRGSGLSVTAAASSGGLTGIDTYNGGTGATSITATGAVTGTDENGINAFNSATATQLLVNVGDVAGSLHGILADNTGTGVTSITTSGAVHGQTAAIAATSAGQPISIAIGGNTSNSSGAAGALAVTASGASVSLTNTGTLTGRFESSGQADSVLNDGTWSVVGGNAFGAGADLLVNQASASLLTANQGGVLETTSFDGLETFASQGLVSMKDAGAGDRTEVSGNSRFEAGSTYAVDLNSAGQSDLFVSGGTVQLLADSTLEIGIADALAIGRYTVVTATGGLTGEFTTLTGVQDTAFLSIEDAYDANNAYLDVIKDRDFADAGLTPNQIATGQGLDSLPGGELFTAVAFLPTDAQARMAFDQLSGEIHASALTASINDSRVIRDVAMDRIRAAFDGDAPSLVPILAYGPGGPELAPSDTERFAMWATAFGSWGRFDDDGNAAELESDTGGLITGADALVGDWRVGLLAGYSRSRFNADDRRSSGDSDNYHLGLFGGSEWGAVAVRTGLSYTWQDVSISRSVAFPGFADSLTSDYQAGTFQGFGEFGYRFGTDSASVEPFANLAHVRVHRNGFTEDGGEAALIGSSSDVDATFTTLGLHASTSLTLGSIEATARGTIGWRHAFGDSTPYSTHAFAGGDAFTIAGSPIAEDSAVIEVGGEVNLSPAASLGVSYNGQFASGAQDHGFKGDLSVKF